MAKSVTESLLEDLNTLRGLKYPDVGYTYFADVTGNGVHRPRIYTIINAQGGVATSELNAATPMTRCKKIRAAIIAADTLRPAKARQDA